MAESTGVDRGDVLWTVDPFEEATTDAQRPLVVLSNDSHPFHDEQWIARWALADSSSAIDRTR